VETKAHLCFLKKVGGRCGCVYGTEGAVDRKLLGTAGLEARRLSWVRLVEQMVRKLCTEFVFEKNLLESAQ
jgi:hypothetical protein